jgi:dATP pyrophosphohydrolase
MEILAGSISTYVFSIVRARPSFLVLYRAPDLAHGNTWQAVHGMIEPGEKAHAAARREMREETGLSPGRFFKTDVVETFYSETTDAVHLVPAFAGFVEGAPAPMLSEEHTAWEWCTLDDAVRRFIWPSQQQSVRTIAAAVTRWPDLGIGLTEL